MPRITGPRRLPPGVRRPGASGIELSRSAWLALSDERDQWQARLLAAKIEAYDRGCADSYEQGVGDGVMSLKHAQHDAVAVTRLEVARWGPGGREHFAEPRPGDYPGGSLPLEQPGMVWLAGVAVGGSGEYRPGWYSPEEAANFLGYVPPPSFPVTLRGGGSR